MATVSVTTTAAQDKAVQFLADRYNAQNPDAPLTPLQYARARIDQLFSGMVQQAQDAIRTTKGDLYNRASDTDQATIDAILDKYR